MEREGGEEEEWGNVDRGEDEGEECATKCDRAWPLAQRGCGQG